MQRTIPWENIQKDRAIDCEAIENLQKSRLEGEDVKTYPKPGKNEQNG